LAEIHGIVYIIIGIFFAISSRIIDTRNQETKLTIFVIAGIVMIIIGIFKLMFKGSKKKVRHKHSHQSTAMKRYCKKCGTVLHSFQQFCHRCGDKIFR
jgi:sulfite exporter TauE/SafE